MQLFFFFFFTKKNSCHPIRKIIAILIVLCYHYKIPQSGWFKEQKFIFLKLWRLQTQDLDICIVGFWSELFLGFRRSSDCIPTWPLLSVYTQRESFSSPFLTGPPRLSDQNSYDLIYPQLPIKPLMLNAFTLKIGSLTYDFFGSQFCPLQ